MKRFLLGALGTLCLAGQLLAQPTMPKAEGAAPAVIGTQPAPVVLENGKGGGYSEGGGDRGFSLVGGFDFLYLRPHFNSNPGLIRQDTQQFSQPGTVGATPPVTNTNVKTTRAALDFQYDYDAAPRFWIGAQSECGLGARGRWFRYEHAADSLIGIGNSKGTTIGNRNDLNITTFTSPFAVTGSTVPNTGTTSSIQDSAGTSIRIPLNDPIVAASSLKLDIWDAEITRTIDGGNWRLNLGAGARYAFIEHNYSVFHQSLGEVKQTVGGVPGTTVANSFNEQGIAARSTFTGGGPTLSVEGLRRMGDSNFGFFSSARGSVLFGRSSNLATAYSRLQLESFTGGSISAVTRTDSAASAQSSRLDTVPILELELGAQWSATMGGMEFMVRPAVVAQTYFNGGNAQRVNIAESGAAASDFGLFGFMLTAGLKF